MINRLVSTHHPALSADHGQTADHRCSHSTEDAGDAGAIVLAASEPTSLCNQACGGPARVCVNWRVLRRSCATWLAQAGPDPKSVHGQIRHSRISTTTDIYAQFSWTGSRRRVQFFARLDDRSLLVDKGAKGSR